MPSTASAPTATTPGSCPPDHPALLSARPVHSCAIRQPNFLPRLSTLAKRFAADYWIVLDDVQFTRRDYRHRARIAPLDRPDLAHWLSLATHLPNGRATLIRDARLADPRPDHPGSPPLLPPQPPLATDQHRPGPRTRRLRRLRPDRRRGGELHSGPPRSARLAWRDRPQQPAPCPSRALAATRRPRQCHRGGHISLRPWRSPVSRSRSVQGSPRRCGAVPHAH